MVRCEYCRIPLRDPISIAQGVGPECLSKRANNRAQALSSIGLSETALGEWAASDDPTLARWARLIVKAAADGNRKYVKVYFDAAQARVSVLAQLLEAAQQQEIQYASL